MRLEDMKNDIPETPDFIHNMIQNEVAKQLADNKVANLRRRKRWTAPKVAAVAAACALAVSTAAEDCGPFPEAFGDLSGEEKDPGYTGSSAG